MATALEVYQDIENLFAQLQKQLNGLIELDSKLILAMSPTSEVALTKVTQYNVNVMDMVKKNFPGLEVITAPEYATASGQLVQLIAPAVQGQEVLFSLPSATRCAPSPCSAISAASGRSLPLAPGAASSKCPVPSLRCWECNHGQDRHRGLQDPHRTHPSVA